VTIEQLIEFSSIKRHCVHDLFFGIQSAFSRVGALSSGANFIQEILMKRLFKVAVAAAVLTLGSALPALAQIDNSVNFKTAFPFYVGNAKMPAASYRIMQTGINAEELLIQSTDGKYSAFVEFIPTHAEDPHQHTDVTFQKYDDVEYLNRIWVVGQRYGMKIEPSKAELKAASATAVVEHSVAGQ
jgi:hypothetical protein